jgi:heme exporter protein D
MIDLDMGKYAVFVWPAWGLSAVVLAALAARALIAARRWSAELKRLEGSDGPSPQAARSAIGQRE